MTIDQISLGAIVAYPLLGAIYIHVKGWNKSSFLIGAASPILLGIEAIRLANVSSHHRYVLVGNYLIGDGLTALMLLTTAFVGSIATVASKSYLDHQLTTEKCNQRQAQNYATLFQLFLAAMTLAIVSDNLGLTWVAIEATTISTAFLVGHHNDSKSSEAAWKYVIICSFGITLAFLGTVILYFSATASHMSSAHALVLHSLISNARHMDNPTTKIGLGLLLLGYGTKVGLVPFHTWLADAHSQAPAPISAVMSGVLLSVAFSVILRIQHFANSAVGPATFRNALIAMGIATLAVAAFLLVEQRDYKRLFAYSSLENMGLIAVAAGVGGRFATAGALLQIFAHGVSKSLVFVTSGQIYEHFGSTSVSHVQNLLSKSPLLASSIIFGTLGVIGFPPFALFGSEISIAIGITNQGYVVVLLIALLLVLICFSSLAKHIIAMTFGETCSDADRISTPRTVSILLGATTGFSLALGLFSTPLTNLVHLATNALGIAS